MALRVPDVQGYQLREDLRPAGPSIVSPESMTTVSQATAKLGQATESAGFHVGALILNNAEEIRRKESQNWMMNRRTDMLSEVMPIYNNNINSLTGDNGESQIASFREAYGKIRQKYLDSAGNNQYARDLLHRVTLQDEQHYVENLAKQAVTTKNKVEEKGVFDDLSIQTARSLEDADWNNIEMYYRRHKGLLDITDMPQDVRMARERVAINKIYAENAQARIKDPAFLAAMRIPENKRVFLEKLPEDVKGNFEAQLKSAEQGLAVGDALMSIKRDPKFYETKTDSDGNTTSEFSLPLALKYVETPEFMERMGRDDKAVERVAISLTRNMQIEDKIYKDRADVTKGDLQVDILNDKVTKSDLSDDTRWLSLRSPDRSIISNFADAKARSDRAEVLAKRQLGLQERALKKQQQQEDATIFLGEAMGKLERGEYADENQIVKDFSKDNYYILSKVNSFLSTFKAMNNSPELKNAMSEISKAANSGLFDQDGRKNLLISGSLKEELRRKFMTEQDFRGDKVQEWLKQKVNPEVENGLGKKLNSLFTTIRPYFENYTPGGEFYQFGAEERAGREKSITSDNLEFTAKKHGLTVDEVKRRLGIR